MANLLKKYINDAGKKGSLMWLKSSDGHHYISGGDIFIKTEAITPKELGVLVEHIKVIPEPNSPACQTNGTVNDQHKYQVAMDMPEMFEEIFEKNRMVPLEKTNLIRQTLEKEVEVFAKGAEYLYLDAEYKSLWLDSGGMRYVPQKRMIYAETADLITKDYTRLIEILVLTADMSDAGPSTHLANLSQITFDTSAFGQKDGADG